VHAGLVIVNHLIHAGELVVGVPSPGDTVLIVEITDREAVIAITIESNVTFVSLRTVRQRIESVSVVSVVVKVTVIGLKVINELRKATFRDKLKDNC
jgi:hypothetical protein